MNLIISGHHVEITPAIREYTTQKIERLKRHFENLIDVKVILSVDKGRGPDLAQKAESTIHIKGHDIFAEAAHSDLYTAVDTLIEKLDRQVLKYKERRQVHLHA